MGSINSSWFCETDIVFLVQTIGNIEDRRTDFLSHRNNPYAFYHFTSKQPWPMLWPDHCAVSDHRWDQCQMSEWNINTD